MQEDRRQAASPGLQKGVQTARVLKVFSALLCTGPFRKAFDGLSGRYRHSFQPGGMASGLDSRFLQEALGLQAAIFSGGKILQRLANAQKLG
jgi:hypothetical protein